MFSRNSTREPLNFIEFTDFSQTPLVNPLVFTMRLVCTLLLNRAVQIWMGLELSLIYESLLTAMAQVLPSLRGAF